MMNWLISSTPWWLWLLVITIILGLSWQVFAPLWLALPSSVRRAILAVVSLGLIYLAGRNRGKKDADEMQRRRDESANQVLKEKKDEISNLSDDDLRKRADRWLRD